jgi:hypothetical protein
MRIRGLEMRIRGLDAYTSPLFSFSFFGPKSGGMSFLFGRTVRHEFILRLSKSSKSLGATSQRVLCVTGQLYKPNATHISAT